MKHTSIPIFLLLFCSFVVAMDDADSSEDRFFDADEEPREYQSAESYLHRFLPAGALRRAIREVNVGAVRDMLVSRRCDVNDGSALALMAVLGLPPSEDRGALLRVLVDAGADPVGAGLRSESLMCRAIARDAGWALPCLVGAGLDPNEEYEKGVSAVFAAAVHNKTAAMNALIDAGAVVGDALPLVVQSGCGAERLQRVLAAERVDVNREFPRYSAVVNLTVCEVDYYNNTVLRAAVRGHHNCQWNRCEGVGVCDVIGVVLDAGADPNQQDAGRLDDAVRAEYEADSDFDSERHNLDDPHVLMCTKGRDCGHGHTPLTLAASRRCAAAMNTLLAADGVDVQLSNIMGETFLHLALRRSLPNMAILYEDQDNDDASTYSEEERTAQSNMQIILQDMQGEEVDAEAGIADIMRLLGIVPAHQDAVAACLEISNVDDHTPWDFYKIHKWFQAAARVTVSGLTGNTVFDQQVKRNMTIENLKQLVSDATGTPKEGVKLIRSGEHKGEAGNHSRIAGTTHFHMLIARPNEAGANA